MNILIAAPNDNFDLAKMRQLFGEDHVLKDDKLFFEDQSLSQTDLESIDVLVGFNQKLLTAILKDDNSQLKFIQALSVGVDYFPMDLIKQRNVKLATVKGVHQEPIAESVIGMILGHFRHIDDYARLHKWEKLSLPMKTIAGKTAVLFGTGGIGKRIDEILKVFHVKTIGVNTSGHAVNFFDETTSVTNLSQDVFDADMIINSLPLTADTKDLFNEDLFKQFKNQPLFINVGRGGSVNTADMISALKEKQLSAISVDVIDPEPFPNDSELWKLANVYVSPHISATYDEFLNNSIKIFDKNIASLKGKGSIAINKLK